MELLYFQSLSGTNGPLDISFLANLTSVDRLAFIFAGMANLDGLANLTSLRLLILEGNLLLQNVNGLTNLSRVELIVKITGNRSLVNLDGLVNLTSIGGGSPVDTSLEIAENNNLANCAGVAPVLGWPVYPYDPTKDFIGGPVAIYNNAIGALSPDDCLAAYVPPKLIFMDGFEEN